jgi:polysaccharide biosynthesis protein PelG
MAGIGFELRRLFGKKGVFLNVRANLYAATVVAGPALLAATLLVGINWLAYLAGAPRHDRDVIVVVVTYSILSSLLLTSFLSFVLTRYVADMLYENQNQRVLPSMYGAISLCLLIGGAGWIAFLSVGGLPLEYSVLSFMLFTEAVVVWLQMSYVNAAKDYRGTVFGFALGVATALLSGYVLIWWLHLEVVFSLLLAVCLAYGVMIVSFTRVLHDYFPIGKGSSLRFLEWVDKYPSLILVGFCTIAGLFTHIMIMWTSPWGYQVIGLFYMAPAYDIPALLAMFTTLVTTVNFVTSVEVSFYEKYRLYFSLLNEGGSLSDIDKAKEEMAVVLKQELFYMAQIQMAVEIIAIAVAGIVLPRLNTGFTPAMVGLFRVLCVGYGMYAIGNAMLLFLLYLSNYRDAMISSIIFFLVGTLGTLATLSLPENYYGFGFVAAGLCLFITTWIQLATSMNRLDYDIFCKQPIFLARKLGSLGRLAQRLDRQHA